MRLLIFLLIGFNLNAQLSNSKIKRWVSSQDNLKNAYVSIALKPIQKNKKIKGVNISKFMTPASNIKLLTVLASIKSGDSINSLKYKFVSDTLHISPTGYPLLEHPLYPDLELTNLLRSANTIVYHKSSEKIERYGPAWAWDDFKQYFSPERSSFPIYGNVIMITKLENEELRIKPNIFNINLDSTSSQSYTRKENKNDFTINPLKIKLNDTILIPYIVSDENTIGSLKHLTMKEVISESNDIINSDNLYSDKTLEKLVPEIQNGVEWFDGSGLSRYNMIQPKAILYILNEIYNHWGLEKIKENFPNNYILEDKQAFVWGKTGTLRNNHNYSGFIKNKKGKYYVFSIMINHFNSDLSDIKESIVDFLLYVNRNG